MARMAWLKLYDEFIDDPKMLSLDDALVVLWVRMMCLANRNEEERGVIARAPRAGLAKQLYVSIELLNEALVLFASDEFRMVSIRDDGAIVLTNWQKRNPRKPSDEPSAVAERKRRWRERSQNASGTRSERVGNAPIDIRVQSTPLLSPRERMDFDRFWAAYPSRQRQKRKSAEEAWARLMRTPDENGDCPDPESIIAAAQNYDLATKDRLPVHICYAVNFLDKYNWEDYVHGVPEGDRSTADDAGSAGGPYVPDVEATKKMLAALAGS